MASKLITDADTLKTCPILMMAPGLFIIGDEQSFTTVENLDWGVDEVRAALVADAERREGQVRGSPPGL
mgnify:CR=1 FL=1